MSVFILYGRGCICSSFFLLLLPSLLLGVSSSRILFIHSCSDHVFNRWLDRRTSSLVYQHRERHPSAFIDSIGLIYLLSSITFTTVFTDEGSDCRADMSLDLDFSFLRNVAHRPCICLLDLGLIESALAEARPLCAKAADHLTLHADFTCCQLSVCMTCSA